MSPGSYRCARQDRARYLGSSQPSRPPQQTPSSRPIAQAGASLMLPPLSNGLDNPISQSIIPGLRIERAKQLTPGECIALAAEIETSSHAAGVDGTVPALGVRGGQPAASTPRVCVDQPALVASQNTDVRLATGVVSPAVPDRLLQRCGWPQYRFFVHVGSSCLSYFLPNHWSSAKTTEASTCLSGMDQ